MLKKTINTVMKLFLLVIIALLTYGIFTLFIQKETPTTETPLDEPIETVENVSF